jgi:hypothetical protein
MTQSTQSSVAVITAELDDRPSVTARNTAAADAAVAAAAAAAAAASVECEADRAFERARRL